MKRGPYKNRPSQEGDLDSIYPGDDDNSSSFAYSGMSLLKSSSARPFDHPYIRREIRASLQLDDSPQGCYSDDEVLQTSRKRRASEDRKISVLANLCSAVLHHSRANSPTSDCKIEPETIVPDNGVFDQEALEVLSAPIKTASRSRSISADTYHQNTYSSTKHYNPSSSPTAATDADPATVPTTTTVHDFDTRFRVGAL